MFNDVFKYQAHIVTVCATPGVPKKAERWIFSTLGAESVVYIVKPLD